VKRTTLRCGTTWEGERGRKGKKGAGVSFLEQQRKGLLPSETSAHKNREREGKMKVKGKDERKKEGKSLK